MIRHIKTCVMILVYVKVSLCYLSFQAKSSQPSASTTSDPEEDQAMDVSINAADVYSGP